MQRRYRGSRSHWRQRTALAVAVAACFAGNFALANPTGPAVAQGQASFATQGNTLTVTNAPGTVINWQGFSIAGNEIARFIQQSQSSSVLNRVVGINPSSILGSLQSNGRVFLVNPNGITIGPGASIDVAGFMASTLNLSDADFLAGRMRFTPTPGAGGVVNQGAITTTTGGMVYLVGQDVQNSGIIRSPQGEILLAAGKSVELVDAQSPEVRVQLTAPDNQALNLGQLIAAGGRIGMYGTLVRNAGVASANTAVMGENGKIVFKAVNDVTLEAGSVTTASGTQAGAGGGSITIEGERIGNAGAVQVNAADQAAAGNVTMLAQRELVLGNTSRIEAKGADRDSSGGRVFLYSHGDATAISGQVIDISGGLTSGNAGSGEFSAANLVSFGGTLLGKAAPGYARGNFLIDPLNFSFTGGTIAANTTVQAEDNITIDGNATINAGITLTLLADHDDNGGSPVAGVWDTGGGGTGTVGVGSITRSGNFTISGGAGSGLIMYAGGGIGIGGSGAIQTDLNGGSLSATINPAAVGAANVAVTQTSTNALSIAGIAAGSNAVALTAGGTIGQTGAISAGLLTTSSAGGTVLNGANLVSAFTASNTGAGNIELTNTIATLDIQGITQNTGDVIIGNTGAITQSVAGITTAADGNINLAASTALTTSQVVTAGGNGTVTLAGSNVVLGANVTGATVNINATGAITRTGGVVTADTINLGVAGNTTAIGATGAGRIRVASTGGVASPAVDARATTGGVFIEQASGDLATSSYSLNVGGSGQSIELATTNGSIAIDHVAQWNANTADDNVSLLAQGAGSNITAGGSTILTANDATLTATGGTVTLPATSLSGALSVTAGGAVTDAGDISVAGTTSITAGTANNITLDNGNDFGGTVTIVSANDVTLNAINGLTLAGFSISGDLNLTAGGGIQQGGAFTVTGTSAFDAGGDVALAGAANSFTGTVTATAAGLVALRTDATSLELGNVSVGTGALTLQLGGDVTQAAATTITKTGNGLVNVQANAAGVNVALGNAGNDFGGGAVSLSGLGTFNNVSVRDTSAAAALGALPASIGGDLTLQFDNAGMTLPGVTVGGNLSLTAGGGIQQGGAFTVTGTSAFDAGGDVALAGAANSFTGTVTASAAGLVALQTGATALELGNVALSGTGGLTLQLGGDVSQAATTAITKTGNGLVNVQANAAGVNVALGNAGNDFGGGAVSLSGLGTFNNVSVRDTNAAAAIGALPGSIGGDLTLQFDNAAMTLPGVTVGGNLSLTAGGGIQQGGAFTVTGTSAFDAGGDVALAGAANSFTGTVTATAAGLVALRTDATPLELGNVSVGTGALTLQLGGDVTQAATTTITKTGNGLVNVQANAAGVNVALGNAGNDFGGGAVSLSGLGTFNNVSVRDTNAAAAIGALPASIGGDLTLQFDNAGMTLPGVTVGGNLSLTVGGTVSVSGNVSSTGTAELTTTSGNIALGADFGSSGAAATLISAGNITRTAGTVSGTDVILDSVSGIGGGTGARVFTAAGNLAARSTGSGGVFLSESDVVTLATLTGVANGAAGTAYDLTAGGTITVSTAVNGAPAAGGTTLATTLGNIALGANVGNAAGSTTLASAGDITRTAGTVSGTDVILDSVSGIGGGTGARVFTAAGNLAARSTGSGGVFLRESDAVTLATLSGVANGAAGGGAYDVASGGNVSVGATVSGGPVNISAAGTIADSAQITGTTLTTSSAGGTVLDFGHAVTGFNATNITGGNIQLVNVAPTLTVTGISQNGGGDVLINNTGALTINGAIGNAGTGGTINLTGSTGINLNQNLTATDGNITLNNATTLGANVQIAAGTGDVTLTGATGIGANNLTVSSSNVTTVTGGITGTTGNVDIAAATRTDVDGAIVLSGTGTVQLDRALLSGVNVTTAGGNITFDGAAATDTAPLQVGSGGGDVLFNNTLTLGSGAGLTVLSGAGTTTFAGTVTGPAALTVTASGDTVFSSAVGAGTALASLGTDGGGLTRVNGGTVTTTGGQTYSDAVTLGADATLAGAGITFSGTLNSSVTARTLQINDSGTTTFSSAVGNTLGLGTLTTNAGGTTAINGGSLVTTGAQTYGDAVTLGANTVLTGAGITFNGTLDSAAAARTLQINDSGTTTFGDLVGNTLALASLTTNTGGTTAINTTGITTTGGQTYNDAVTLGALATLTSSGGSNIRFVDALDGSSGLIVNTAGNTIFSAVVGGTTPLASLTTDAAGSTQVNGGAVTTVGTQTYNDGITIAGPTTFNATAATGTLDFNATLAAATHALTLTADEINFAGGAGSVTGSGLLTLQPNNTAAAFNIGSVAGATVGALDLSATDLAALGNGFSAINLGQAAGTHAITIGNAAFQDPLLVRTPAGGSVNVSGALSSTQNIAFNAGGAVQGSGSVTGPRVTFVTGGIGSLATPLQLNTPDIDLQNSTGNAVVATAGSVNLLNNFSNTAAGGELRLIANNGAINTGAVAVQNAGGRIALIANDTTGGATGNIMVGAGGITSAGGDIVLHAADNITINGAIASGAGNVRMLAGTGPGINAAHASFTGTNPPAPTELATDDFGFITFNAPVSAANMVLVSSTSATPTVVSTITQTAAGSIATTGALTAVTLRGAGAPGNGGGTIDLNDAAGNNSTGLINLFACSFDGCPNALPTAPFVNQGTPVLPFTTAVYSDGQLFYSDVGGTDVTGIGTSGDFTLYTPGSVSITGPSLSAKNLTIEALVDINVNLLAPFTNNDINGGQPGGSLNFIAGQNVNYTSMVSGATIGSAAVPFNHDLRFLAAGNVTVANAIYVGAGNFVVRANEPASLNNNTVNIPASGTGSVFMQGNHVVSSMGDLTVSGINLTVQGGDTGSANQSAAGQQLLSAGAVNLNLLGDVTVNGGTATGGSDSAAIIRGAVVNVGSAGTPVANLSMTGGNSTVAGTTNHEADARIEGTTALNVHVAGDVDLAGGTAVITGAAGSSQKAGASAILKGNSLLFSVAGNVTLTGGTANAATGGNTATANAQIVAGSAFNPVILGDLDLVGGSATAQPIAGEIANAVAGARFESAGDLLLKVGGNINLQGGNAVAINNTGGVFAEADASALVHSDAKVGIEVGQDFGITGGSAVATGAGLRAIGSAGVSTGDIAAGESLLIKAVGNMSMTGGSGSGAAADAAALIYSGAEAKLNIGGPAGLRLEGGTGPFFPPFSTGVFTPNSNLFHMIGGNALVRLEGSAYPITVTGLVTVVNNPALGAALFISEAPPLNLDSLLAAFIKTTDCVSFSGGSCTLSGAVASGSGKGAKDPVGGVCK